MNSFTTPLEAILDPGERLLWSGQPKQGVRLQAGDIFMIPFSLMWGGFAIFWEVTALTIHHSQQARVSGDVAGAFFPLFGVPFVLAGLYVIFGRFFYDSAARARTYYGITNQRLIVFKSFLGRNVTSFDYSTLPSLTLKERGDQSGDILFGTPGPMTAFAGSSWPNSGRYTVPGFYLLPDARQVYNAIREAQRASKQTN